MNDRYREFFEKLGKRLDLVLLAAGAVLLVVAIYLLYREQEYVVDSPEQPRRLDFSVRVPLDLEGIPEPPEEEKERFERLRQQFLRPNPLIEENDEARVLIDLNPFSRSEVEQRAQATEALSADHRRADRLFRDGDLEGAEGLVESILARDPRHPGALRLQERIAERRAEAAEEDADAEG